MKYVPLSLAATLALLASPIAQSADAPKKPGKAAAPAAKPAAPAKPGTAPAAKSPSALPAVVAVVEGKEIKGSELEEAFGMVLARKGVDLDAVPEDQRSNAYHQILDDLIVSKLVEKRSADVKVPEEEVTATLDKIKAQVGSEAELKKQIEARGQTVDTIKEDIRASLRQQRWIDSQIKDGKKVTEADAETFFKEHPDQFKRPEEVRASHILIAIPQDAKPEIVVQKEKAAQAAATRVKGGEDFAKVAQEISEDPTTKAKGGDLNFFSKGKMVPEFDAAAFALKKDAISEPVRSPFGYHIIKVTDRRDAGDMALDEVKPQLLAFLQRQQQQESIVKVLKDIRAGADVKISLP